MAAVASADGALAADRVGAALALAASGVGRRSPASVATLTGWARADTLGRASSATERLVRAGALGEMAGPLGSC